MTKKKYQQLKDFYLKYKDKRVRTSIVVKELSSFTNRSQVYILRPYLQIHAYHPHHQKNYKDSFVNSRGETSSWWSISNLGLCKLAEEYDELVPLAAKLVLISQF
jgi:hypothetical protein